MKLTTMTQLIMLLIFAITLNVLSLSVMLMLMAVCVLLLAYQKNNHFLGLIKRLKWFYLVMFLIFIFNTPGEHILSLPYGFKLTYEGLQMAVAQALRITLMLAALSLIIVQNTTQQLISGIYFLLKPLSALGVDVKRFAARLSLTLHYVESSQLDAANGTSLVTSLKSYLDDNLRIDETQLVNITLENIPQTWLDYVAIALMLTMALLVSVY